MCRGFRVHLLSLLLCFSEVFFFPLHFDGELSGEGLAVLQTHMHTDTCVMVSCQWGRKTWCWTHTDLQFECCCYAHIQEPFTWLMTGLPHESASDSVMEEQFYVCIYNKDQTQKIQKANKRGQDWKKKKKSLKPWGIFDPSIRSCPCFEVIDPSPAFSAWNNIHRSFDFCNVK